ncbi:lysophospholipid acyltransferase family protein [Pantanalinema sp. GBBB05]|uniref:lysophospholipid acyltransferase family protein n=1 Tax=Pantanalinema sp. GBBB05 TaxID=2604139 RepID=UPI001E02ACF5|nr:1-acyl-sn-glycerol-3-phosphate acyltransferase [Pantanalinema sp. GBBB05]
MSSPKSDFYPPRLNLPFIRFAQLIAPGGAYLLYQIELDVDYDSLNQLLALRDQRVLLLPNHPTFQDPIAVFLLSGKLGQRFYYLAAYEQFQGLLGKIFQWLGVYSIRRGLADRASIAQTIELLSQSGCHLVIFPEGGCSFQNDIVMPFRAGAVQLAFQAMNRSVKQGQPIPDLYVVPVSIKYRYTQDMTAVIEHTLSRLEQTLHLAPGNDRYERLRIVGERILTQIEQEYGIENPLPEPTSWDQRITRLKFHVLANCEQQLGLTSAPGELDRERVYKIQNALQEKAEALDTIAAEPQTLWNLEAMRWSMIRILNFDALHDGYVAAAPTPERFLETLIRLEREVFKIDQPPPKGHRRASLRIGTPVNLKDYFAAYQQQRTETIATLVNQFQQTVQSNLDQLSQSEH